MANVKFTDLPSATTLTGAEIAAVVQSGSSKQVAVSDLVPGLTTIVSKLWTVSLSAGAEAGNKRVVTATVKDLNNATLAVATQFCFKPVTAVDASYAVSDEGSGTALSTSGDKVSAFLTAATGIAQIGFTDTAVETIVIEFETPQGPVVVSLAYT